MGEACVPTGPMQVCSAWGVLVLPSVERRPLQVMGEVEVVGNLSRHWWRCLLVLVCMGATGLA